MEFQFFPLSSERWNDFEILFGKNGACGGCWCMNWRLKAADYERSRGEGNRKAMQALVRDNAPAGVLAYANGQAVGWCAVAPREMYVKLENSRILKRIDEAAVWSVSCFFIQKHFRRKGLSVPLLQAAAAYAMQQGATIVEGYPHEPKKADTPDVFIWTGVAETFLRAGFTEAARYAGARPIMRLYNGKQ
jgi:GNAT superfamily N-acetyltransferase